MKNESFKNTRKGWFPNDMHNSIDYNETFSLVARMDTIRAVLAIAAHNQWHVYQMDVKSSFLNGIHEE